MVFLLLFVYEGPAWWLCFPFSLVCLFVCLLFLVLVFTRGLRGGFACFLFFYFIFLSCWSGLFFGWVCLVNFCAVLVPFCFLLLLFVVSACCTMAIVKGPSTSAALDTNDVAGAIGVGNNVQVVQSTYSRPSWDQLRLQAYPNLANGEPRAVLRLEQKDYIPMEVGWGYCLAGFVTGKFPGIKAVERLASSWRPTPDVSFQNNGLIIFRFKSRINMMDTLRRGPYFIFQRPLSLHLLPSNFTLDDTFQKEINVWVKIHKLPMELWHSEAIGKVVSQIGTPIKLDEFTFTKKRIDFVRALVSINTTAPALEELILLGPDNIEQKIEFEFETPPLKMCSKCRRFGHYVVECQKEGDGVGAPATNLPSQTRPKEKKIVTNESRTATAATVPNREQLERRKPNKEIQVLQGKLLQALDAADSVNLPLDYTYDDICAMGLVEIKARLRSPTVSSLLGYIDCEGQKDEGKTAPEPDKLPMQPVEPRDEGFRADVTDNGGVVCPVSTIVNNSDGICTSPAASSSAGISPLTHYIYRPPPSIAGTKEFDMVAAKALLVKAKENAYRRNAELRYTLQEIDHMHDGVVKLWLVDPTVVTALNSSPDKLKQTSHTLNVADYKRDLELSDDESDFVNPITKETFKAKGGEIDAVNAQLEVVGEAAAVAFLENFDKPPLDSGIPKPSTVLSNFSYAQAVGGTKKARKKSAGKKDNFQQFIADL